MEKTSVKKETSIEWLMTQLYKKGFIKEVDGSEPINLMNQAKEMEKEQIIQARTTAPIIPTIDMIDYVKEAEQYYNETFKSE